MVVVDGTVTVVVVLAGTVVVVVEAEVVVVDELVVVELVVVEDPLRTCARAAAASTIPQPKLESKPVAPRSRAVLVNTLVIWAGVRSGLTDFIRATTPATSGDAKEVPPHDAHEPDEFVWLSISVPGATRSIWGPTEENEARVSEGVVAPTAITPGNAAG